MGSLSSSYFLRTIKIRVTNYNWRHLCPNALHVVAMTGIKIERKCVTKLFRKSCFLCQFKDMTFTVWIIKSRWLFEVSKRLFCWRPSSSFSFWLESVSEHVDVFLSFPGRRHLWTTFGCFRTISKWKRNRQHGLHFLFLVICFKHRRVPKTRYLGW